MFGLSEIYHVGVLSGGGFVGGGFVMWGFCRVGFLSGGGFVSGGFVSGGFVVWGFCRFPGENWCDMLEHCPCFSCRFPVFAMKGRHCVPPTGCM